MDSSGFKRNSSGFKRNLSKFAKRIWKLIVFCLIKLYETHQEIRKCKNPSAPRDNVTRLRSMWSFHASARVQNLDIFTARLLKTSQQRFFSFTHTHKYLLLLGTIWYCLVLIGTYCVRIRIPSFSNITYLFGNTSFPLSSLLTSWRHT